MRIMLAAVAALSLVGLLSAQELTVKFKTILQDTDGGPRMTTEAVIRNEKAWKMFVATVASTSHRALLAKQTFDFDKEIVVAVARGSGHSVSGKEDGVSRLWVDGKGAVIEWTVIESDQQESSVSYPFHVVRMSSVKEVQFKKTTKTVGG